jgi:hypothetical protein
MPHTALGSNHSGASVTTIVLTTSAAVPAGDTIVVVTGGFNSPVRTMTITGGSLTWTNDKAAANGSDFIAVHHANAPSGLASGTALTCTYSAQATGPFIAGASFPSILSASPVDLSSSATPATGTAWAAASITTTVTDTVLGAAWGDGTATSSTPTSPWSEALDVNDATSTETLTLVYGRASPPGRTRRRVRGRHRRAARP